MKLTDLEARFVRIYEAPYTGEFCAMPVDTDAQHEAWVAAGCPTEQRTEMRERSQRVETLAEAGGVSFKCPKCGAHRVAVSFAGRGLPDHLGSHDHAGRPSRWQVSGTGLADLTLQPSIDLSPGGMSCGWHGFVTNGEAA